MPCTLSFIKCASLQIYLYISVVYKHESYTLSITRKVKSFVTFFYLIDRSDILITIRLFKCAANQRRSNEMRELYTFLPI